jgi:nitroimidazol reductase NimA-like FMN-containing flavoprotein (pyridoxamine 5'-phosphate oxidase superfamily)
MKIVDARTGIEVLPREECLRLLAQDVVGRLGIIDGDAPVILPVNYAMDGETIVLRTGPGTKLDHGTRSRACFEIDAFDRERQSGWSVLVSGRLEEVTRFDPSLHRVEAVDVVPWADGDKPHWLRLTPTRITGRRVG